MRHLFGNFEMKVPRALLSDEQAAEALVGHRFFEPHVTPVQVPNRETHPMLRLLDERGLTNHVLVISRWRVEPDDCAGLDSLRNVKLTLLPADGHDQALTRVLAFASTRLTTEDAAISPAVKMGQA